MKEENSNKRRGLKIAAGTLAGAGLLSAGGHYIAGKKKLRIGTPLSKVTVAKHVPIKLRKATGRVVDMAERVGERLREFTAISTEELPYSSGLCGYQDKPNFPSLYLSRSTNPALMKMPGEGQAVVNYKIRRREIDESREDGQPLYGGSIEIRSIEPIAGEEEEGAELESTLFLREFGVSRDRDGEGRFASGNIPGPDDFAVAQAARRKKVAAGAGVGALAGGALLVRSAGGRALVGRLTQGATRAAGRLIS